MAKYRGLDYRSKDRTPVVADRAAIDKPFEDDNPERNRFLEMVKDRLNFLMGLVDRLRTREADDLPFTDAAGSRTSVGAALEAMEALDHARLHDIDSAADHGGVTDAVEDNFASFNASGLPKDSGSNAASFDAAGTAATAVSDHEAEPDPHPQYEVKRWRIMLGV